MRAFLVTVVNRSIYKRYNISQNANFMLNWIVRCILLITVIRYFETFFPAI
jgi:hypothetical protein